MAKPPPKPFEVLKRLKVPDEVPQPKFVRDAMGIDDIEGVRSKRLYRGAPKDIFKTSEIEGAQPHKVKRSPRSYAFDDYKDVTSARKYRRPFVNSSSSIQNQYFSPNPAPRSMHNGNYAVPEDLYNNMDYWNLPKVEGKPKNTSFNAYNQRSQKLNYRNGNNMSVGKVRLESHPSFNKIHVQDHVYFPI